MLSLLKLYFSPGPSFSRPAISCPAHWSFNFMSCYFMPCNFDGLPFSRPAFSVNPCWFSPAVKCSILLLFIGELLQWSAVALTTFDAKRPHLLPPRSEWAYSGCRIPWVAARFSQNNVQKIINFSRKHCSEAHFRNRRMSQLASQETQKNVNGLLMYYSYTIYYSTTKEFPKSIRVSCYHI